MDHPHPVLSGISRRSWRINCQMFQIPLLLQMALEMYLLMLISVGWVVILILVIQLPMMYISERLIHH